MSIINHEYPQSNLPLNFRTSNSLITTKKPHYPTKRGTSFSIVPGLSRPYSNGINSNVNSNDFNGPDFKARPIKHWRRQLRPTSYSGITSSGNRVTTINLVDQPGAIVFKNSHCECDGSGNAYTISDRIKFRQTNENNNVKVENQGYVQVGVPSNTTNHDNNYEILTGIYNTKCISCNPQNNIIRSASTLLSKAYYSTHASYLKSRCNTYDQNISIVPNQNVNYYDANGNLLWPNNNPNGPQVYTTIDQYNPRSTQTCNGGQQIKQTVIYKPNNKQFGTQGAVTSSTRLDKLKLDTVNKNAASLRDAFGNEGSSACAYRGYSDTPYFLKNKYQPPICSQTNNVAYYRQNHTICYTN